MRINGIYIDPKSIQEINELKSSFDWKWVQSLFRKVNFVWRFIIDYTWIAKPVNNFFRKG